MRNTNNASCVQLDSVLLIICRALGRHVVFIQVGYFKLKYHCLASELYLFQKACIWIKIINYQRIHRSCQLHWMWFRAQIVKMLLK